MEENKGAKVEAFKVFDKEKIEIIVKVAKLDIESLANQYQQIENIAKDAGSFIILCFGDQ